MDHYADTKRPYWTQPRAVMPLGIRYRLRLDREYVIQASGSLLSKRWKATLYLDTAYGLFPVSRTGYRTDPYDPASAQEGALKAMCGHAEKSRHAKQALRAVGGALAAMKRGGREKEGEAC